MIPAEAVEAAHAHLGPDSTGFRYVNKARIRELLEAAAPHMQQEVDLMHMMAEAWDAAIDAAYERRVIGDTSSDALKLENPYRPAE